MNFFWSRDRNGRPHSPDSKKGKRYSMPMIKTEKEKEKKKEKEKGKERYYYSSFRPSLFLYLHRRSLLALFLGLSLLLFHYQLYTDPEAFESFQIKVPSFPFLGQGEENHGEGNGAEGIKDLNVGHLHRQLQVQSQSSAHELNHPITERTGKLFSRDDANADADADNDEVLLEKVVRTHKDHPGNHVKAIQVEKNHKYNSLVDEYLPDFTLPAGVSVSDMVTLATLRQSVNVLGTVFDVDGIIKKAKAMSPKEREDAWTEFELSSDSIDADSLSKMKGIVEEEAGEDESKLTREEQEKKKQQREKRAANALLKETKAAQDRQNKKRCLYLKENYEVESGTTWGTLNADGKKEWKAIDCDWHLLIRKPLIPQYLLNTTVTGICPLSNIDQSLLYSSVSKTLNKQKSTTLGSKLSANLRSAINKGISSISGVKVMDTELSKTPSESRHSEIMSSELIPSSFSSASSSSSSFVTKGNGEERQPHNIPMVSIMAGVTTKGIPSYSLDLHKLAIVMHLIPSILRMAECGFSYNIILGFDAGDKFFDSSSRQMELYEWFLQFIYVPLLESNINIQLNLVRVHNKLKKPGPVFLEMAKVAYFNFHSDFYYRVNDDTEFSHPWTSKFANAIISMGFPYGAIGPLCREGNTRILTHDFVHATHMAIMDYEYYPPDLVDWWMDDWISRVYGSTRTIQAKDVEVLHHTTAHGRRYEVDKSNGMKLDKLVHLGKAKIHSFMKEAEVEDELIDEFVHSQFDHFILHGINGERGPILNKPKKKKTNNSNSNSDKSSRSKSKKNNKK